VRKVLHILRYLIPLGTLAALALGFLVSRWTAEPPEIPEIAPAPESMLQPLAALDRARSLQGKVVAPDASPVGDALVWVRAADEPHWTYSDAAGEFHLEHLGPDPWKVSVVARGFDPILVTLVDMGSAQTIHLVRAVEPPPTLAPIARSQLRGLVIPALPGTVDVQGYEVVLTPRLPPENLGAPVPRRVTTDRAGAFTLPDLAHGAYSVRVLPYWARGGSWPDLARSLAASEGIAFVHNASTAANELRIQLENGSITGVIQNSEKMPLEAALVIVAQADDPARVWPPISTAVDGSFTARDLPAGSYSVGVRAGSAVLEQRIDVPARTAQRAIFEPLQTLRAR
jgi:hypothetical protein